MKMPFRRLTLLVPAAAALIAGGGMPIKSLAQNEFEAVVTRDAEGASSIEWATVPGMYDVLEQSDDLVDWEPSGIAAYGFGQGVSVMIHEAPEPDGSGGGGGGGNPPASPDAGSFWFSVTPLETPSGNKALAGWLGVDGSSYQVLMDKDFSPGGPSPITSLGFVFVDDGVESWSVVFFGGFGVAYHSGLEALTRAALPAAEQATYDRLDDAATFAAIDAYLAANPPQSNPGPAPGGSAASANPRMFYRVARHWVDSDGDGWWDHLELSFGGTSPFSADSDGNGVPDPADDHDGDGVPNEHDYNLRLERQFVALSYEVPPEPGGGSSVPTYPTFPTITAPITPGEFGCVWNTDLEFELFGEHLELGDSSTPGTIRGIAASYLWNQAWEMIWSEGQDLAALDISQLRAYGESWTPDSSGTNGPDRASYLRFRLRLAADRPLDANVTQAFIEERYPSLFSDPAYTVIYVELPAGEVETPEEEYLLVQVAIPDNDRAAAQLRPPVLRDVNDTQDGTDDVIITPWDTTQNIAAVNIAWIDAHTSPQNAAPRMPQLEFEIPGLPAGHTVEAKFEVNYERGNGSRGALNRPEDQVRIPANGGYSQLNGGIWRIWQSYQNTDFFGGDAVVTYRVLNGGNEIVAPQSINFRIGGANPDDGRSRAFIEAQQDAAPGGDLWFAYAIAKHESANYNNHGLVQNTRYNQFLELPRHRRDVGRPVFGDDRNADGTPRGPGGYGMFQVTIPDIPREQIWNWQENVTGALAILRQKRDIAWDWMNEQANRPGSNRPHGQRPQALLDRGVDVPVPDRTVRGVLFSDDVNGGRDGVIEHAVTMKAYNSATAHYCSWGGNAAGWVFNNTNGGGFDYVDRVCSEVEN